MLAGPAKGEEQQYLPLIRCKIDGIGKARRPIREEWLADEPKFFKWVD